MAIEVKLSLRPDEYDLLRECVKVTLELTKFYRTDKTAQRLTDVEPRHIAMLSEYLGTGKRRA